MSKAVKRLLQIPLIYRKMSRIRCVPNHESNSLKKLQQNDTNILTMAGDILNHVLYSSETPTK